MTNTDNNTNTLFLTDDIPTASYLLFRGAKLSRIEETRPKHLDFFFQDSQFCNQLKSEYMSGATAPIRDVFAARASLVREMRNYQNQRDQHGKFKYR